MIWAEVFGQGGDKGADDKLILLKLVGEGRVRLSGLGKKGRWLAKRAIKVPK